MPQPERQPVRILTDIASSMRPDDPVVKDLNVKVLPLHVAFPDGKDVPSDTISDREFYSRLSLKTIPTTSAVNVTEYEKGYQDLLDDGAETVFSIHISGKISATLPNAEMAAMKFNNPREEIRKVEVIDTKTISLSQWFIVERAAEMAKQGEPPEAIMAAIQETIPKVGLLAVFENLDYFRRGGRLAQVKGAILSALSITPILGFDKEGTIMMYDRERTLTKARTKMVEIVKSQGELIRAAIIHTNAPELAQTIKDNLATHFAGVIGLFEIGPTLAVHGGPNVAGICWERKDMPTSSRR